MNVKRSRNSSETDGSTDGSDGNTTGVIMSLVVVVPFCFHLHCEKPKPQMGPRLQVPNVTLILSLSLSLSCILCYIFLS